SAHTTGFGSTERCGANEPPSRTPIGRCALTWLAADMCPPSRKEGEHPSPLRENRSSPLGITLVPDGAKGFGHHTRCRARKEKGPRSLRTEGLACVTHRRVHARGMAEDASPGTAGPRDPTTPTMLGLDRA